MLMVVPFVVQNAIQGDGMDERDVIWNRNYEVYYDSFYYEMISNKMIQKWLMIDSITKILVAITTSGSAIAAWQLWNKNGWHYIWIILAGLSAILSIVNTALNVTQKIKDWTENKRSFSYLRVECETNKGLMSMDSNFDKEFHKEFYIQKMEQYGELYSMLPNDILLTKKIRIRNQNELNALIQI